MQRKQRIENILSTKDYYYLAVITIIGAFLRFYQLDLRPFFVDEALFGLWVREAGLPSQEWIPILLGKLMPDTEIGLRWWFALAGTLTIPAMYFVTKKNSAALLVAIFPLFIFWSRMARPYAIAGLFIVLGWRWFWFYIPALLSTPVALTGIKFIKQKWFVTLSVIAIAVILFYLRPDTERFTNTSGLEMWLYSSRFWYIPALAIILYFYEFILPKLRRLK